MTKFFNLISRQEIGQQLLSLRQTTGLTIEQVAEQTKITIDQIKVIEMGGGAGIYIRSSRQILRQTNQSHFSRFIN